MPAEECCCFGDVLLAVSVLPCNSGVVLKTNSEQENEFRTRTETSIARVEEQVPVSW